MRAARMIFPGKNRGGENGPVFVVFLLRLAGHSVPTWGPPAVACFRGLQAKKGRPPVGTKRDGFNFAEWHPRHAASGDKTPGSGRLPFPLGVFSAPPWPMSNDRWNRQKAGKKTNGIPTKAGARAWAKKPCVAGDCPGHIEPAKSRDSPAEFPRVSGEGAIPGRSLPVKRARNPGGRRIRMNILIRPLAAKTTRWGQAILVRDHPTKP